jgi:hypothetical protein
MTSEFQNLREKDESQFFYDKFINCEESKHVAWIDLMGIRDHLKSGQVYPAVLRGELLSVCSKHLDEQKSEICTAGDGVIITTEERAYLMDFLRSLFRHYTRFNVKNWQDGEDIWLSRLLRAGVATGEVQMIDEERYATNNRNGNPFHSDFSNDQFGPAIINALTAERGPPYSINEYTSAGDVERVFWWQNVDMSYSDRKDLLNMFVDYFSWYKGRKDYEYPPGQKIHLDTAITYFKVDPSDVDGV